MRLKPTKSTLVFLGGALGLLVAAIGGILWFLNGQLTSRGEDLQRREAELKDGQKIAKQRDQASLLLEQDRKQILFLESSVSDAVYVPTLLKQVEDLAKGTHNRVLAVRPQVIVEAPTKLEQRRDPNAQDKEKAASESKDGDKDKKDAKKPEPYTRLGIGLNLIGSYKSTEEFIEKLNHFPKIVSVDEIQLHPHGAAKDEPKENSDLEVELKLTAFIMKTPAAPAAGHSLSASAEVKGTN